jgi:hypothetical protein
VGKYIKQEFFSNIFIPSLEKVVVSIGVTTIFMKAKRPSTWYYVGTFAWMLNKASVSPAIGSRKAGASDTMGSMKGPSSDISAGSRVVPEGENAIREALGTTPGGTENSTPGEEDGLVDKRVTPLIPPDLIPLTPDQSIGPVLPGLCVSSAACEAGGNDVDRKQTRQVNDPVLDTIRSIEFDDEGAKRRSWKVIGKLAVMAKSMNAHTIDIYHDRKLNTSRFMIHPNSKLRRLWEVTTVCLVLYVCVMVSAALRSVHAPSGRRCAHAGSVTSPRSRSSLASSSWIGAGSTV